MLHEPLVLSAPPPLLAPFAQPASPPEPSFSLPQGQVPWSPLQKLVPHPPPLPPLFGDAAEPYCLGMLLGYGGVNVTPPPYITF